MGNIAFTYLLYKVTMPIRIPMTLGALPVVAKLFNKTIHWYILLSFILINLWNNHLCKNIDNFI